MRRREFIKVLGVAVAGWPLAANAQQMRRIAVMIALAEDDPESKKWLTAFRQVLDQLGWSDGLNLRLDYRFAPAGARAQEFAKELVALQPDVILAFSTPVAAAFQRERRAQFRSCLSALPTPSAKDSSPIWRDRTAISPA